MRVLLRADASRNRGTGHVMRCLTLAEELIARGARVELMTDGLSVDWLRQLVAGQDIAIHDCGTAELPLDRIRSLAPDWIVIDSYDIPASQVGAADAVAPVLAIIDEDDRGIRASLYLDHNLGAELVPHDPIVAGRLLAGSDYALIRDAVLTERRPRPWEFQGAAPSIVSFMGGTDPTGASLRVAIALDGIPMRFGLTVIAPADQHPAIEALSREIRILSPTPDLPGLLGGADLIVSAAGTSAWDVATLGIPAVLVGVVDNQEPAIREAGARGVAFAMDADDVPGTLGARVAELLADDGLRRRFSETCRATFDGRGKQRVVDAMLRMGAR